MALNTLSWQQVRHAHPHQWVLLEAIEARSEKNKRILDGINVVEVFLDSEKALRRYLKLHRENHQKELYVAHTDREDLDITERKWLGIRTA